MGSLEFMEQLLFMTAKVSNSAEITLVSLLELVKLLDKRNVNRRIPKQLQNEVATKRQLVLPDIIKAIVSKLTSMNAQTCKLIPDVLKVL